MECDRARTHSWMHEPFVAQESQHVVPTRPLRTVSVLIMAVSVWIMAHEGCAAHAPFRGTRDYECFSSDWLSSIAPLAGAIDHACDGYIGKSFVSPTW